jgi:chromosome segregation ATPase
LADADKWHTRYNELRREHDANMLAAAEAAGRAEVGLAELRAENKLKAFEAERMRMQCEQAFLSARQSQVDADARAEKLEVLKAEYYALKSSTGTTIAQLQAKHDALHERVAAYEKLEEELDTAVLQSGALAAYAADGSGTSGASAGTHVGDSVQPLIRVPSSAQRRMQQCLGLAKDLLGAQRRAEVAEAALLQQKGEVERMAGLVDELNRKLRQAGQPHNVLAEQVELAEARRDEAEAEVRRLATQLAESKDAHSAMCQQNEQMLRDMESLLSQRGSLEALRNTLTRLLPADLAPTPVPSSA